MNEREKKDKGEEEGGTKKHKNAEDLGKELLKAAKDGEVESVRELLQCEGVNVRYHEELWDGAPITALVVACERGHVEIARLLLEHGGETRQELEGAFWRAARDGHAELVKMLMERGADASARDNNAVRWAARNGHVNVVKLLLQDKRVNPAAQENYAVNWTARNGHCDVLEVLLADPRVDAIVAIRWARSRAVHILLEDERCGIRVNRALFLRHHKKEVARYDELVEERMARICAVSWVMGQIENGWGDLRDPMEVRMAKQPVNWDKK
jgi:hypothetical protein